MNDFAKEEIDRIFEQVMKIIVGSKLFGVPVTDKNIKLLVVAAYFYGMYGDIDLEE